MCGKFRNRGLEGPQSEQKEEEEEEEEEEEALCRNAGLAYSFALFELDTDILNLQAV